MRDDFLTDLGQRLIEKGISYEVLFEQIMGIRQIEQAAVRFDEFR